jgi:sugar diacid utilization regulator
MTAVAERPRERHGAGVKLVEPGLADLECRAALAALAELATLRPTAADRDDVMRRLVDRACDVLHIARGAVYVRDEQREVFVGCASHPAGELQEEVRRLVLGGPTDRITREILERGAPVLIRDTSSDPRALTSAVRNYKIRALLGLPMIVDDEVLGVLMLDNHSESHRFAPVDIEIATAFAALGAAALKSCRETGELRAALDTATRQNRLLRRTTVAEHRLSDAILGGGGLSAVVELVTNLTGKPAALYDFHSQLVASSTPEGSELKVALIAGAAGDTAVRACLEEVVAGASATIEPSVGDVISRRHLVAPIDVRGERWGWLVIMEHPSRLAAFDDFLIRRAATHLALELASRRQMVASSADARAMLARQLIRGTTVEGDLRRQAEFLGVRLESHRVVAYFNAEPDRFDAQGLVEELHERLGTEVLATRGPDGFALLIEIDSEEPSACAVRHTQVALTESLGVVCSQPQLVGVSAVCRGADELPGGYRMALQVTRCIECFSHRGSHRVLAADDLGPGRLFVANSHPDELRRFVEDVLGDLLAEDDACTELVRTLDSFYETGRSVRLASERLGVHENTVRYRLSRVHAITGLDVAADADDQLSVQVALLVLRLQSHPSLRSFEDCRPAPQEQAA